MDFFELVKKRRSCRAFDGSPVSDQDIDRIIEAGCWAPSPLHLQPWSFIVVKDASVKASIREVSEKARQAVVDNGGPGWAAKYPMDFLEAAPVMIAVLSDPAKGGLGDFFNQKHGALQAASACVQNMMLAASDLGYESLWFTFFDPAEMGALLGVPEKLDLAGLVAIGRPQGEIKTPPRKEARVFREKYEG